MSTLDPERTAAGNQAATRGYAYADQADHGEGWVLFAGIILGMLGVLNLIDGIAAVSNSTFFTENAQFVLSGLNTWGWVLICTGVVQCLAAIGVWARTTGVRWLGVAIAVLNGMVQLMMIDAYPFWSLALFTLDILVIYGLVVHGGKRA